MELGQSIKAKAEAVGLEPAIRELMAQRASQLNGCAFCLDMHAVSLRKLGVSDQRLDVLPAWREAGLFTARERAALALAEAITFVHDGQVPDDVWNQAAAEFTAEQLDVLVWSATTINAWNRLAITTRRPVPGR